MKRFMLLLLVMACCWVKVYSLEIDSLFDKKFGKVTIYHPKGTPGSVAIFVSGDGGWKHGVLNMARNIANQGALVLGIDALHYARYLSKVSSPCFYPAADFEELSLDVQKKYKMATYHKPVLIGYSYGAVLVYGILAQAPANTFKGAIALGFCPDITLNKPLCKGLGLTQHVLKPGKSFFLEASKTLAEPFIVLNGVRDQTCPFEATAAYLKAIPMTQLVTLPKVGHGFSIDDNWLPQFNAAYKKILANTTQKNVVTKDNMPLTLIPSSKKNKLPLVFLSPVMVAGQVLTIAWQAPLLQKDFPSSAWMLKNTSGWQRRLKVRLLPSVALFYITRRNGINLILYLLVIPLGLL